MLRTYSMAVVQVRPSDLRSCGRRMYVPQQRSSVCLGAQGHRERVSEWAWSPGPQGHGERVSEWAWSLGPQGHRERVSEWAWSPGAQGQVIVPGAAAGAAAGPAGPAGCPARAPGSAGKGLLNVAATARASGRRTGLPAAVSTLPGAGGPAGVGGRQGAPGKRPHQPPTPCTRFTGPPPPLPAALPAPPHSWPRWGANPGCGLRQLGICLSWGEKRP